MNVRIRIINPHSSGFCQSTRWLQGLEIPGLAVGARAVVKEYPEEGVDELRRGIQARYPAVTVEIMTDPTKDVAGDELSSPFASVMANPDKETWISQCTSRKKRGEVNVHVVTTPDGKTFDVTGETHQKAKSDLYDSFYGGQA